MQKQNIAQLEMFALDAQGASDHKGVSGADSLRLKIVRGYQKLILKGIAVIFISLIAFSLGVEKGKAGATKPVAASGQKAPLKETAGDAIASRLTPEIMSAQIHTAAAPVKPPQGAEALNNNPQKPNYTIQVASISKNKNVASELASLKNKGYSAFGLVKGKYTVICVGRFEEKEDARNNIGKLKTRYPDCQIRRL